MNTQTSYTYDTDLMPGCEVTAQGLACPTAQKVVKVIPSPTYAEAAPQVAYAGGTSPLLLQQQWSPPPHLTPSKLPPVPARCEAARAGDLPPFPSSTAPNPCDREPSPLRQQHLHAPRADCPAAPSCLYFPPPHPPSAAAAGRPAALATAAVEREMNSNGQKK
eukprot:CAMPEP_0172182878 /NCGR_PEP_ID=MMETSP1050-20130122/18649_1 /TAXON_ID=233186 /ORGANISM="Cryptomonas curvata, Strain CCAP979/52" /LENGTH=162 /DNA_ID=CAMNT_0012856383 /DNA_START=119 /DNA_END=605 /DNA_ORIENTATION=+